MSTKWILIYLSVFVCPEPILRNTTENIFTIDGQKNIYKLTASSSPDISTSNYFPQYRIYKPEIEHLISDPLEVVINLQNNGNSTKFVKAMYGYLANAEDPTKIIQQVIFIIM